MLLTSVGLLTQRIGQVAPPDAIVISPDTGRVKLAGSGSPTLDLPPRARTSAASAERCG
ncbi:MAG: hypothetical protein U0531_02845 [Dehalococcoidia bacterium]